MAWRSLSAVGLRGVWAALFALWLWWPATLAAQTALDDQVRALASELRCPVCQNLSVADSPSELARQMRDVIREQLEAGKTPQQVREYFIAKYGDWVLLSPRPRGLSWLVWVGPFVAVGLGFLVAIRAIRRWARPAEPRQASRATPALLERVRREAADDAAEVGIGDAEARSPLDLERDHLYATLRELDFDRRSGKLSPADYEAMRQEYEVRAAAVLEELDRAPLLPSGRHPSTTAPAPPAARGERASPRRTWRLAAGGAFLLVFGLTLGYFLTTSLRPRLGEQDSITGDFLTGTGPGGVMPGGGDPSRHVDMLVASGRAAYQREDWRAAIDAFRQALAVDPQNREALTLIGLILLRAGHVDEALASVERALASAPRDRLALWARGLILFEGKRDYAGAIAAWEALAEQPLSTVDKSRVAELLAEARTQLVAPDRSPGPPSTAGATITGTVALAPSLPVETPAAGALFIIARKGSGPPLAVKRIPNPTFPVEFSVGPEDRMLADRPFEGQITLLARLKRDGSAGPPASGDLEGQAAGAVRVGQRGVRIVLDRAY